jgi:hypothetical protein
MKVRKSIKVFAAIAVCVMLALTLFLVWDFSGPYRGGASSSWRIDDLWRSTRGIFDIQARREEKCYKVLDAFARELDGFIKANPDDVEVQTGAVALYSGWMGVDGLISTIRSRWPQYEPAMELQAWHELHVLGRVGWPVGQFDYLVAHGDPNSGILLRGGQVGDLLVKRDDPFVRIADNRDDPNTGDLVTTDVAAARRAIVERVVYRTDLSMTRLRHLTRQDPNNALYYYVMAVGYSGTDRPGEAAAALKASAGRKVILHTAERQKCLKKFMAKAELPGFVQELTAERMQLYAQAQSNWLARALRKQAAQAQAKGDATGAELMLDAAQKIVDASAAAQAQADADANRPTTK